MIGTITRGSGFGGLVRYLLHGDREEPNPDRVAWIVAENLPTEDPELAASVMRATANQNPRGVEKPVWHLSLAWHPDDEPTRAQMEDAARRVLYQLGLSEHQALLVAHRDTEHAHVHIVVNRVHPESLEVWKGWRDMVKVEQALRYLELENGYRATPGHHGRLPGQERPDRTQGLSQGEQQQRQRERAEAWSERMRETLRPHFRESQTWAELEHRLAEQGVSLQKKGRGLVVTDGAHQVKASRIDRGSSIHKLEARFGMPFNDWRAQVEVLQDTVDQIQRTQARHERLDSLRERIADRIRPNREVVDHHEELQKWCDRERANLWPYFPRIYRPQDAEMAFKGFLEQMQAQGVDAAAKVLTQTPKRFGRLHGRGVGRYCNEERGLALRNINSAVPVAYRFSELQQRLHQGRPRFRAASLSLRHLRPRIRRIAQAINDLSAGRRIDALEKDLVRLGIQMGVSAVKLALPPQVAQVVIGALRVAQLARDASRGLER